MRPRRPAHRITLWLLLVGGVASACRPSSAEDVATSSSSIVDGNLARVCEWPSVGVLLPSACSAALVQRRALVTAAHCLFDAGGRLQAQTSVLFGERRDEPQLELAVDTCFVTAAEEGDFAVCVLSEDAPGVPTIPLMAPSESEWLKPGETAVEVGFGDTRADASTVRGTKTWLEVYLVRARSDEAYLEVSSGTQSGEYYGDSGGPLFFEMPDATWRLVGTDSGSPDIVPGSSAPRFSIYANAPSFVDWAERVTGLDLTSCHDPDRSPASADCGVLAPATITPLDPADSWADYCGDPPGARPRANAAARAVGGGCNVAMDANPLPTLLVLLAFLVVLASRQSRRQRPP
jgi:hypothetical protein